MRWKVAAAAVLLMATTVVVSRIWFVDTVRVSSDSMRPTLCTGDALLLARLANGNGVRTGDIVAFTSPQNGEQAIKRVVGVAGQSVAIDDATLVIDGRDVAEPFVDHASIDGVYFGTVVVPADTVFLMGDDREISVDSRQYGPVPTSAIDGRLLVTLWSAC